MKAEWAGIQVITDHRFVVRHAYGDEILVTNLEKFEHFVGKHGAHKIMERIHQQICSYVKSNTLIKDALRDANEFAEFWIMDSLRAYMPYAYTTTERELYDWTAVITTVNSIDYYVCTISHQAEGEDDRLHIDFYCEEQ